MDILSLPENIMTKRQEMVERIKSNYNLNSPVVFGAMLQVPRDKFAPKEFSNMAYDDRPVPIGFNQTMSQPYTVAFMTHLLLEKDLEKGIETNNWKVLEVGTGSGYQAAILSHLVGKVFSVEIIPELAKRARIILTRYGYSNVKVKVGSGEWGWEENAPYDVIMITAGVNKKIPNELIEQLAVGGILVAPIGQGKDQTMTRFTKREGGVLEKEEFGTFSFVPFIHETS